MSLLTTINKEDHKAVYAVVCVYLSSSTSLSIVCQAASAIRNWCSGIGKHALKLLSNIFSQKPFKSSPNEIKEYIAFFLEDLCFLYRDPEVHVILPYRYNDLLTYMFSGSFWSI